MFNPHAHTRLMFDPSTNAQDRLHWSDADSTACIWFAGFVLIAGVVLANLIGA